MTAAEQQLNYLYGHPIAVTPRRYKGKAKNWLTWQLETRYFMQA
jgi:hypothetical protein